MAFVHQRKFEKERNLYDQPQSSASANLDPKVIRFYDHLSILQRLSLKEKDDVAVRTSLALVKAHEITISLTSSVAYYRCHQGFYL